MTASSWIRWQRLWWRFLMGKLTRYAGNYSEYRAEKRKRIERQRKSLGERQKEEEDRLNAVIEQFRHKPTKASFARAKKKQLERMERVEKTGGG